VANRRRMTTFSFSFICDTQYGRVFFVQPLAICRILVLPCYFPTQTVAFGHWEFAASSATAISKHFVHTGFLIEITTFFASQLARVCSSKLATGSASVFFLFSLFSESCFSSKIGARADRRENVLSLCVLIYYSHVQLQSSTDRADECRQSFSIRLPVRRRADGCETARSLSENVRKHPITWSAPARYSWPSPLVRTVLRALFEAMYCLHALGPLARAERAAEGSALDADRWRRDRQGHGP